jgi:hypothetical protein
MLHLLSWALFDQDPITQENGGDHLDNNAMDVDLTNIKNDTNGDENHEEDFSPPAKNTKGGRKSKETHTRSKHKDICLYYLWMSVWCRNNKSSHND